MREERMSDQVIATSPGTDDFLRREHGLLIGGAWEAAAEQRTLDVEDPATGQRIATVAAAGAEDVDRAVQAAHRAFAADSPWRRLTSGDRSLLIHRLADLVEANASELAELESLDNGKPRTVAAGFDVAYAIRHLRYYAGWPTKLCGDTIPVSEPDMMAHTRLEPVGVAAQIIPWNYPLLMAAWKLGPALAAGCTVVLKPAEQTPLSALRLGELICDAEFPPGVVNILPGTGPDAGAPLVEHPLVRKVAFTGSTEVGTEIAAKAARHAKRVTLELGGKSPVIVLADSDPSDAAQAAFDALFANSGQSCIAGSRLFVEKGIFDRVLEGVVDRAENLRLGHGLEPETTMGPLVSATQVDRVDGYVELAREAGGTIVTGGQARPSGTPGEGHFFAPTILTEVADTARPHREEIFGPVLIASPFASLDEVIERANATEYGLAASVWTRDIAAANRLANGIDAGSVYLNLVPRTDAAAPFGGFKRSGWGREMGFPSPYLETKTVWTSLI
jgi:acyl-CoA reductase-like NAD-dependent aldehyde dehydrogenase